MVSTESTLYLSGALVKMKKKITVVRRLNFCPGLNTRVAKICIKKEDFPNCYIYYKFVKYLSDLPGDGFFVFDKDIKRIVYRIATSDWGNFFLEKETM